MPIHHYKPTSAGRRISSVQSFADVTKKDPEKSLIRIRKEYAGRVNGGQITVRHRGGGEKQFIRIVDGKRDKLDIPAVIAAIEYDPNRGARLALLYYKDGEKRYILAPHDIRVGEEVICSQKKGEIKIGNRFPLECLPVGSSVHDVEIEPGKGAQMVRGAGSSAQLMAIEGGYATLKLPSGEIRMFSRNCMATIGQVSNLDYALIRWGKAGRTRHRGFRPTVRGKVMNPVDHPHGGGEGRNSIGLKNPKTPTGKPALGVKTRRHKASDKLIVQRRPNGRFVGKGA